MRKYLGGSLTTPFKLSARKFARAQRSQMSRAEALLWQGLRNRGTGGPFRRQMPIGPYFADFACPSCRLIVEVDGRVHSDPETQARDQSRQAFLEKEGWRILRFADQAILDAPDLAIATIKESINRSLQA